MLPYLNTVADIFLGEYLILQMVASIDFPFQTRRHIFGIVLYTVLKILSNLEDPQAFQSATAALMDYCVEVHFQNYCLRHFGKFSCAVDWYAMFRPQLHNITRNDFLDQIYESCIARQNLGAVDIVREPVWSYIRNFCPSFSAMTADAVFSDVFTMPNLGNLSENLNSLFLIQQTRHTCCTLCGNRIIKTGNIIVLYITCSNPISKNFENHVSEAVLPSTRALYCDVCQGQSGDIRGMQHFLTLPTFLNIELSSQCVDHIHFPLNTDVLGNFCTLKAVVCCASHHFTITI